MSKVDCCYGLWTETKVVGCRESGIGDVGRRSQPSAVVFLCWQHFAKRWQWSHISIKVGSRVFNWYLWRRCNNLTKTSMVDCCFIHVNSEKENVMMVAIFHLEWYRILGLRSWFFVNTKNVHKSSGSYQKGSIVPFLTRIAIRIGRVFWTIFWIFLGFWPVLTMSQKVRSRGVRSCWTTIQIPRRTL